jgi:hypothetical protein
MKPCFVPSQADKVVSELVVRPLDVDEAAATPPTFLSVTFDADISL